MFSRLLLSVLFILFQISAISQNSQSSEESAEEHSDTVIIVKKPVVIHKTYLIEEPIKSVIKNGLEISIGTLYNFYTYYNSCHLKADFNEKFFESRSPLISYQLNLSYFRLKKLYWSAGIGINTLREKVSANKSININSFTSVYVSLYGGIPIKSKKLNYLITAGFLAGKLLNKEAYSLTENGDDFSKINVNDLYKTLNFQYELSLKVFKTSSETPVILTPFYLVDMLSFTKATEGLILYRHFGGLKLSLMFL